MDWRRAKSVLIFAFIMLNILLGYQLWLDVRERLESNMDMTDLPPEIQRIMQEKNVRLIGKIPAGTPVLPDLEYRFKKSPDTSGEIPLKTPVNTRIVFNEKELLDELGDTIPSLGDYAFDSEASTYGTDGVFVLYRMQDKLPMFDVRLELRYSNQKIIAFRQLAVEQVKHGKSREQAVLSASKAIGRLIEKYLQPGSAIKDIRLGYHGLFFDTDMQVATPSWRVLLEDGEIYYINALTAEVVIQNEAAGKAEEGP
ncbi:two-component system regulatory protein YycI [Paenibacillus pinihumi]|uniref:two-component system regulatory protein YycI n=1 Tax=Paenibacillus pinihumi TaxID=669462 RepID=UPI00041CB1A6|nr:two-component system regulatory protein YycI [Paenibacillus pinihumi]